MTARVVLTGLVLVAVSFHLAAAVDLQNSSFHVSLGAGWGQADQRDINDQFLENYALPAGMFDGQVGDGATFFGELGYSLRPSYQVSVGLSYVSGSTEGRSRGVAVDDSLNVIGTFTQNNELEVSAVVPHVRLKYLVRHRSWSTFASGGITYLFGRARLTNKIVDDSTRATLWENGDDFTGRGFGWIASVGADHRVTGPLRLGVEGGYRRLLSGDLEDDAGELWRFDGSIPPQAIRLDFSGWFVMGIITVEL